MTRARAAILASMLALPACGAGGASRAARLSSDLAAALESSPTDAARRARDAISATARSEEAGLTPEADEHASRARAWADVDLSEREVVSLEETLGRREAELLELEAEASRVEHDAERARSESLALREASLAREELARALARAEADESVPRRARRLGLSEGPELLRLADVLGDRARLLATAARSLGASAESLAAADAALARIEQTREPIARLAVADEAHGLARHALADARHRAGEAPSAEEIASLAEAIASEGFTPLRDEQGLGARVPDAFDGQSIAPAMRGRLRRLAELLASHPHGPVLLAVEADASREAQARAQRRLAALRAAIVGASGRSVVVSVAVEVRVPGSVAPTEPNAARVVLPAYVARGPAPIALPSRGGEASADRESTPDGE